MLNKKQQKLFWLGWIEGWLLLYIGLTVLVPHLELLIIVFVGLIAISAGISIEAEDDYI